MSDAIISLYVNYLIRKKYNFIHYNPFPRVSSSTLTEFIEEDDEEDDYDLLLDDKEQTKFVSLLSCIAPAFRDKSAFAKKERGKKIATVRPIDFVPIELGSIISKNSISKLCQVYLLVVICATDWN